MVDGVGFSREWEGVVGFGMGNWVSGLVGDGENVMQW